MEPTDGARTFNTSGDAYDRFMGRYSRRLAAAFADAAGIGAGQQALDVGCGPGAFTRELAARLGPGAVQSCDPSPPFVAECAARNPGVEVRQARAEELPYSDGLFDVVAAQLVMHFVSDPAAAVAEMMRVARPGARLAACVWDFQKAMVMLRAFWDAAITLDPLAPDELRVLRFGQPGELVDLFEEAGVADVAEVELTVEAGYDGFDELWDSFMEGIGPAGSYAVALHEDKQLLLRDELYRRLGSPVGGFTLAATARAAVGTRPA